MKGLKNKKGFTLIELIIVIGVLAILLTIILQAVNPARQFAKANDVKRRSSITAILNAIGHYLADNNGSLPPEITTTAQNISKTGADLCPELVTNKYITALPVDPKINNGTQVIDCSSSYDTGFTVVKDSNNRVTITAPLKEIETSISVTR